MQPVRWSIGRTCTLGRAARSMIRHRLDRLFVVDSGVPVGSISEHDILDYRLAHPHEPWWRATVEMARHDVAATIGPDDSVEVAIRRFSRSQLDVLPVVTDGLRVVGQLSARDILELDLHAAPESRAVRAADIMTEPPVIVTSSDGLLVAAGLMASHQIRHLPVIEAGMVVGMLSDRDIRTVVGNPLRFVTAPDSMRALYVRDAMTAAPATIPADCELNELATRFADAKIGALPVVDRDARLVGIVSYVDVLRALATERHQPSIGVGKPVEPAVGTE